VFEPRYIAMVDDALKSSRIIAVCDSVRQPVGGIIPGVGGMAGVVSFVVFLFVR